MSIAFRRSLYFLGLFLLLGAGVLSSLVQAQPPNQTVDDVTTRLLTKMRAEKISPQKAWEDGLLTKETLLYVLGEPDLLDAGRGLWQPGEESHGWSQLLVDKLPELLKNPELLTNATQVRIGLFFLGKGDSRGAKIMENLLENMPRENPDMQAVNAVIYNLSNYYRGQKEYAKAIEVSLKVQEFTNEPSTVANLLLGAARATYASGDKEGAKQLYEHLISYGYGWATGHAYNDMAGHLFKEGKLEEGRALLKKPIAGGNADQIRVVLNQRLAQSYYETGEWEEAKRYAQATVDQYNSLANPIKNHGLEWIVDSAKNLPRQIDQWKDKPVQVSPSKIVLKKPEGNDSEEIHTYFNIHSYRNISVKATSTDADVKVWPLISPHGYESRNYRMMGIEISPAALKKDLKAEIIVTVKEFPDVTFRIPITLQEPGARPEYQTVH